MKHRKKLYYKGMRVNMFGLPVSGFSKGESDMEGSSRVKRFYNRSFDSPFRENSSKDLIVMYDVTEDKKRERDWFRRQLIKFNYIMIQRSVWVGPSPLPKYFLSYVKLIGLKNRVKTFKLAKSYTRKGYGI